MLRQAAPEVLARAAEAVYSLLCDSMVEPVRCLKPLMNPTSEQSSHAKAWGATGVDVTEFLLASISGLKNVEDILASHSKAASLHVHKSQFQLTPLPPKLLPPKQLRILTYCEVRCTEMP